MRNDLLIRECTMEDLSIINLLSERTFRKTFEAQNSEEDMEKYLLENFSKEGLEKELQDKNIKYLLALSDGNPVAYMKLNFGDAQTDKGHEKSLEVQRIYVLKAHKGKKIGKKLIENAIEIGKEKNLDYIWLGVWEHNNSAIAFYEKLGFKKFDTHIFVLGEDQQTDHLMKLVLRR